MKKWKNKVRLKCKKMKKLEIKGFLKKVAKT